MFPKISLLVFTITALAVGVFMPKGADCAEVLWTATLDIREVWDSNPSISSEGDESADVSEVESDFVTHVAPQISVSSRTRKVFFELGYIFSSSFHRTRSDLDDQQHTASLGLEITPSRTTTISFTDTFRYTQTLTDSLSELTGDIQVPVDTSGIGIQTTREDVIFNTAELLVSRQMGPNTSAGITLADSIVEYANRDLIDSRTDLASLFVSYTTSPNTTFNMTYGFSNIFYDLAEQDGASEEGQGIGNNIETHTATLGIDQRFSPSLVLSLSGGGTYTPDIENSYGWTAEASITKTSTFSSVVLGYSRGLTHASGLVAQVSVNETLFLDWSMAVSDQFDISVDGSYSKIKSESALSISATGEEIADGEAVLDTETYGAGVRADWRPLQWLTMYLSYSHHEQISNDSLTSDITRKQAVIGFTASYGQIRS